MDRLPWCKSLPCQRRDPLEPRSSKTTKWPVPIPRNSHPRREALAEPDRRPGAYAYPRALRMLPWSGLSDSLMPSDGLAGGAGHGGPATNSISSRIPVVFVLVFSGELFFGGQRESDILSLEEYVRLSKKSPYVLNLSGDGGSLLYFGAAHTYDPSHPQLAEVERLWIEFRPTVAFSEGSVRPLASSKQTAVARFSEAGLVRFLADADGIPVFSLEPERSHQVEMLAPIYSPGQIKLFFVLRQVTQYWRNPDRGVTLEDYLEPYVRHLNSIERLEAVDPRSVSEIGDTVARLIPDLKNWTRVPSSWFAPLRNDSYTNHIARKLNELRDRHMVKLLIDAIKGQERVFAVVGFSHVVMQEPALRAKLN